MNEVFLVVSIEKAGGYFYNLELQLSPPLNRQGETLDEK